MADIAITLLTPTSIRLSWAGSGDFEVWWKSDHPADQEYAPLASVTGNTYDVGSLSWTTTYYFKVRNVGGEFGDEVEIFVCCGQAVVTRGPRIPGVGEWWQQSLDIENGIVAWSSKTHQIGYSDTIELLDHNISTDEWRKNFDNTDVDMPYMVFHNAVRISNGKMAILDVYYKDRTSYKGHYRFYLWDNNTNSLQYSYEWENPEGNNSRINEQSIPHLLEYNNDGRIVAFLYQKKYDDLYFNSSPNGGTTSASVTNPLWDGVTPWEIWIGSGATEPALVDYVYYGTFSQETVIVTGLAWSTTYWFRQGYNPAPSTFAAVVWDPAADGSTKQMWMLVGAYPPIIYPERWQLGDHHGFVYVRDTTVANNVVAGLVYGTSYAFMFTGIVQSGPLAGVWYYSWSTYQPIPIAEPIPRYGLIVLDATGYESDSNYYGISTMYAKISLDNGASFADPVLLLDDLGEGRAAVAEAADGVFWIALGTKVPGSAILIYKYVVGSPVELIRTLTLFDATQPLQQPAIDAEGNTIVVYYCNKSWNQSLSYAYYKLSISTDNGVNWTEKTVTPPSHTTVVRRIVQDTTQAAIGLSNGVLITHSLEYVAGLYKIHLLRSTDNGDTWSDVYTFSAISDGDNTQGYPIIRTDGAEVIFSVCEYSEGAGPLAYLYSSDSGVTWTLKEIGTSTDILVPD